MSHRHPVSLTGRINCPSSVTIRDIVSFFESYGASAGCGEVAFHTFSVETRKFPTKLAQSPERVALRRAGTPTLKDVDALGDEIFTEGFIISGHSTWIAVQRGQVLDMAAPRRSEIRGPDGWSISWYEQFCYDLVTDESHPEDEYEARCAANSKLGMAFARSVLEHLPTNEVRFERSGQFGDFPGVPLVHSHTALYAVPKDVILEKYTSLDAFAAGFDSHEVSAHGAEVFVKGEDLIEETELWKYTIEQQFTLAKAAKPGLVEYKVWRQPKAHGAHLLTLPQRLEQVGYSDAAQSIEFTAFLPDDETLSLRDLYYLTSLKQKGLPNGEPLEKIIVTFANQDMAERSAWPLHEMGIVTQYHATDGTFKELAPQS